MPFKPLHRRTFLRASGVTIGLPFLDAMRARAAEDKKAALERVLLVGRPLGMYTPTSSRKKSGRLTSRAAT